MYLLAQTEGNFDRVSYQRFIAIKRLQGLLAFLTSTIAATAVRQYGRNGGRALDIFLTHFHSLVASALEIH
jgi:hypothetical protein